MAKAVIFGSNGQDGFYLRKLLASEMVETLGVSRSLPTDIVGSVADYDLVSELIKKEKPEYIFHLAANSSTRHDALWDNHDAIATGSLNILESACQFSRQSKIFLSGSGLQFENKNLPIDEAANLVSTSPYVIARNYSLSAARYYRSLELEVFFGFLFNHDSPKRGERHVAQKIASYCKHVEGQREKLKLGNIDIKKEWTFAGDTVRAMWTLVNQRNEFEAVIGSGVHYSIREWLEVCFTKVGKDWKNHIEINPDFVPEYDTLVSNPKRLMGLGWRPQVDFYQLAELMMNSTN